MSLQRILEPEVMDTIDEALDYDAMDHDEVNRRFVHDLLAAGFPAGDVEVLDLGTGTARIPIELCSHAADCRIWAVDAAPTMLDIARLNIELAGVTDRIQLDRIDAKQLPYENDRFPVVMSNSIVHHLADPLPALREAWRVTAPGGLLFFRDLLRPSSLAELHHLVDTYAAGENDHARALFSASLHAALTLEEVRALVVSLGCEASSVGGTSDRHWTWVCRKSFI